jgi:hypothetical protein
MSLKNEFEKLKEEFNLKYLRLSYDSTLLEQLDSEAAFNYIFWEIILKNNKICSARLYSLLHEVCHALQYKEGRMHTMNYDKLYLLELEAEDFATKKYKERYSHYGPCPQTNLASRQAYKKQFKNHVPLYWGLLGDIT